MIKTIRGVVLVKKIAILLIYVCIGILIYSQKANLLAWTHHDSYIAILISMLFVALLVFVPAVPFILVAGTIGAGFGIWLGTIITLFGATLGSVVMFYLARTGFQDIARKWIGKYKQVKQYEHYLTERAFISVLLFRLIPVVPSPVVNAMFGLSNMRFLPFFIATLVGKLPMIFVYSWAGNQMTVKGWKGFLMIYGPYTLAIMIITFIFVYKQSMRSSR